MITHVSGTLAAKEPTSAVVDVHGLGYRLSIPTSTFEKLPARGEEVTLLSHLHVREDALLLYGFSSADERSVFKAMIAVSGVGPKLALAALSAMRPVEIRRHVLAGDAGFLTRIPGVGKKTAERLIIDLRDRLNRIVMEGGDSTVSGGAAGSGGASVRNDALAALEALGFSNPAAERALQKAERAHPDADSAEILIRSALRDS